MCRFSFSDFCCCFLVRRGGGIVTIVVLLPLGTCCARCGARLANWGGEALLCCCCVRLCTEKEWLSLEETHLLVLCLLPRARSGKRSWASGSLGRHFMFTDVSSWSRNNLITLAEEEGIVFGSVCLSLCLFVCLSVTELSCFSTQTLIGLRRNFHHRC